MRIWVGFVLCSILPGWGLCELLCRSLTPGGQSCCETAQITTVHCCTENSGCTTHGAVQSGCACAQDAAPATEKTPKQASEVTQVATAEPRTNDLALLEAHSTAGNAIPLNISSRELLSRLQRFNL